MLIFIMGIQLIVLSILCGLLFVKLININVFVFMVLLVGIVATALTVIALRKFPPQ
jgi:hypothetical protein